MITNFEEIKRKDEMKELLDFEQKIITKTYNNEKIFEKFGLLDNEWIEKYKNKYNYNLYLQKGLINNKTSDNIFKIDDLSPKFKNLELDDGKEKIKINIFVDFFLVSKKFIGLISKNFENENERKRLSSYCFDALKSRKGLIIKDKEQNRILYCQSLKNNNVFNIKFILQYINQVYMDNEIEKILKENFSNYFKERNISIGKIIQKICFSSGKKIGYFYLIINDLKKNITIRNGINRNAMNIKQQVKKKKIFLMNENLNLIFLCLYQFKDLIQGISVNNNDVNQNEAIITLNDFFKNFQTLKKESFNKIQNIFKSEDSYDYYKTISSIFNSLNPEKIHEEKNTLDNQSIQAIQYEEEKEKKLFIKNNKRDSIFQNLFYFIKERIISCSKCNLSSYKFAYLPILLIKNEIKKKIQDIIFEDIKKKGKVKCNFCFGEKTDCIITIKNLDFPKILIIKLEITDIRKFDLKENLNIINNNVRYELICFIDLIKKVYFKKDNNWNSYDNNYEEQTIETLKYINPIVLFYKLENKNADNHTSSNNINSSNFNIGNNINSNNPNNLNNNYNNISGSNSGNQNFISKAMSYGIMNKMSSFPNTNGFNMNPNNIKQNNMNIYNNVNLMNNSNNIQSYNAYNIKYK